MNSLFVRTGVLLALLPLALLPLALLLATGTDLHADEPLAPRIDALIQAKMGGSASPRTTDTEFLRRVYLDVTGRVPSTGEARAFLTDTATNKRELLIDRLLDSPEYAVRMSDAWHVMLLERQGESAEWRQFLRASFSADKPWDQLVRDMIWSESADESRRGSAFFLSKRLENYGQNPVDYPGLVRDVGRLLLGVDVQCAQCHDHLFVDQYKQDYYQGLFAFLGQVYLRTDVKFPAVAEKPVTQKVEFSSVFVKEPRSTGPKLPGGMELEIPVIAKGEEYLTPPDKKTNAPGVLKFSPLKLLAEQLPRADNPLFARNAVNRLWWLVMGRGLVHPLDLQHADNPPSHPELLDLLSQEFVAHGFRVKWLLRELLRTEVYQRSSQLPDGVAADDVSESSFRTALERPLSAEQMLATLWQATGPDTPRLFDPPATEAEQGKLRERFTKAFANPPKEPETEYSPSVKAALFLSNDEVVLSWFQPRMGNLVERLQAQTDDDRMLDELYLAILTRTLTDDERAAGKSWLMKNPSQRLLAISRLAWALASSTEFALNH
ncbi:MAG: DUF1549 domain-containing protein [Planctomycetota bacterium]